MYRLKNKDGKVVAEFQEYENLVNYKKIRSDIEFTFEDTEMEIKYVKNKKVENARPKKTTPGKRVWNSHKQTNLSKAEDKTVEPVHLLVPMAERIKNWAEISVALDKIKTAYKNGGGDKKG